jgi:sugar lactone lactonase YvrE
MELRTCTVSSMFSAVHPVAAMSLKRLRALALLATIFSFALAAIAQSVSFAGVASTVGSGFGSPYGVAVDAKGDVFVADNGDKSVKEVVAVNGQVSSTSTTVTIKSGFSNVNGVAVDASGDVFVTDGAAVKEIVAVAGQVSLSSSVVLVGSGFAAPYGLAVDASGDVFVADHDGHAVKEIVAVGGSVSSTSTVKTVGSGFTGPEAVAVDASGDVYVADTDFSTISEIAAVGGLVSSTSTVNMINNGFGRPDGLALDAAGDLFVTDANIHASIREIVAVGGQVSPASKMVQLGGEFTAPAGVALSARGNIFVADSSGDAVYEIQYPSANFGQIKVGSTSSTYTFPFAFNSNVTLGGVAVLTQGASGKDFQTASGGTCKAQSYSSDGDSCTVNVTFNPLAPGLRRGAIVLYDNNTPANPLITVNIYGIGVAPTLDFPPGFEYWFAGLFIPHYGPKAGFSGDGGPALSAEIDQPFGVAFDGAGNLYFGDKWNFRVRKVDTNGIITTVAGNGTQGYSGDGGPATSASLYYPRGVAVDGAGNLYILDASQTDDAISNIRKVDTNGNITTIAGGGLFSYGYNGDNIPASQALLNSPLKIMIDGAGNIYIVDYFNQRIRKIDTNGIITTVAGNGTLGYSGDGHQATSAELDYPESMAMDVAGDLFIADTGNYVVRKVDTNGIITTFAGNGTFSSSGDGGPAISAGMVPESLAVDAAGNLWEGQGKRVRKIDTSGIITATVGNGIYTDAPDGTVATQGGVNTPEDLAFDDLGNLYIADTVSNKITKIDIVDPPSLAFLNTNVGSSSAAQDVTVENRGNATLTFNNAIPNGDFTLLGPHTTCITVDPNLSVDGTCIFGIEFAPLTGGPQSGGIVVTDNAFYGNPATQTILISGTGIGGPATPTVTTAAISAITQTTAFTGGNVTADGGATVTARGVCWGTSPNPTFPDSCTSDFSGTGAFNSLITGLTPGTQYHVRAYATNSIGTAYGSDLTFNTLSAATPTINWGPLAAITYGSALGSGDLSATATYSSTNISADGTFAYTIGSVGGTAATASTILPGGSNQLCVQWTPSSSYTSQYTTASECLPITVNAASTAISWSPASPIIYPATLGSGQFNASVSAGSTNVVEYGSFVYYVGAVGGTVANSSTVLPVGNNQQLCVLWTPSSFYTADYSSSQDCATVSVISTQPTTTTLAANNNPVFLSNSVTFTATITPTTGSIVPTGSVTFYDGSTAIGTGTLSSSGTGASATARLTTTSLAAGSHAITAGYPGDSNNQASNSAAVNEVVVDFTITSTGSTSATIEPGLAASFIFTVSPVAPATTFPAAITLTATGLPKGATYTLSPATIASGAGWTTVTLNVITPITTLSRNLPPPGRAPDKWPLMAVALLLLPLAGRFRRAGRRLSRMLSLLLLVAAGLAAAAALNGCGGLSSGYFGQAPATFAITVTGNSGSLNHSASVSLTVE